MGREFSIPPLWPEASSSSAPTQRVSISMDETAADLHRVRPMSAQASLDSGDQTLTWVGDRWLLGATLGGVLWNFIELTDGDNEVMARFADTYGPLGLGLLEDDPPNAPPMTESVAAWRSLAKGLRSLITIAVKIRDEQPVSLDAWVTAYDALIAVTGQAGTLKLSERLLSSLQPIALYVDLASSDVPGERLNLSRLLLPQLVAELLDQSSLSPALVVGEMGESKLGMAFPATPITAGTGTIQVWQTHHLADAILCAAIAAMQSKTVHVCSFCEKPFEAGPEPGADKRRFCSETCRHEARLEQKRVYARTNYAKRKAITS